MGSYRNSSHRRPTLIRPRMRRVALDLGRRCHPSRKYGLPRPPLPHADRQVSTACGRPPASTDEALALLDGGSGPVPDHLELRDGRRCQKHGGRSGERLDVLLRLAEPAPDEVGYLAFAPKYGNGPFWNLFSLRAAGSLTGGRFGLALSLPVTGREGGAHRNPSAFLRPA